MNTVRPNSDNNNEVKTDYISYDSIYNEVLDKVKRGLEKQRSNSSINKKVFKKNQAEYYSKDIQQEDIPLFDSGDSDDSDSDDFLEWENSDNDVNDITYNNRFKGGLTRAKSHINELNNFDNGNINKDKAISDNNLDIIKDRIVLNKHFQKIYGFNDSSFRHGNYDFYNNNESDSDNDSEENVTEDIGIDKKENHLVNKNSDSRERDTEPEKITEGLTEEIVTEIRNIGTNNNGDLEKQFYNELHRASMIIDLQQHYRIRDGLKNKEDLKQEIVDGYNILHNEKYSSEDLPDFQNLENLVEVKAKIVNEDNLKCEMSNKYENNKNIVKSSMSSLNDINKVVGNNDNDNNVINKFNDDNNNSIKSNNDSYTETNNNQLVNDTWKFLFNNPYSLKFLSKHKSSDEKTSASASTSTNNEINTLSTEKISNDKNTEKEENSTEKETLDSKDNDNNNNNIELNDSIISSIHNKNIQDEQQLKKNYEEAETIRKNRENDWLSFVQKELASIKHSSSKD